jgi:hypothetical protein
MAVLVTTYGGVYGTVSTAQKKANRLALAAALNAAVLLGDFVWISGTLQVCSEARATASFASNAALLAAAAASVTESGTCKIRGLGKTLSIIDHYVDYGAGPTKVINNSAVPVAITSGIGVGEIIESGAETLRIPGETFLSKGLSAGASIVLSGWPTAGNNGTFVASNFTTETDARYTNAGAADEPADGDSAYEIRVVPSTLGAACIASTAAGLSWDLADFQIAGPTSFVNAATKDLGTVYGIWHQASSKVGTNNFTVARMKTTGRIQAFLQRRGGCVFNISASEIQNHMAGITLYDDKESENDGPTAGRGIISRGNTYDCQGFPLTEASDGQDHGIAGYLHPHSFLLSEGDHVLNASRVAWKQYSQSDGVEEDFSSLHPQVPGEADIGGLGVGAVLRNCSFTALASATAASRVIETTDGDCVCLIDGLTFNDSNALGAGIYPRCSRTVLRNIVNAPNLRFLGLGTAEARQDVVRLVIESTCSFVESRTTGTWIDAQAGWHVDCAGQMNWTAIPDGNSFCFKAPKVADVNYPYPGSLIIRRQASFIAAGSAGTGAVIRVTENAPLAIEEGAVFSGGWGSAINVFTNGLANINLHGDGPDFSGLTVGNAIFFQETGGSPDAGCVRGCLGQVSDTATQNAVRYTNGFLPGNQALHTRLATDPTTRVADGTGLVKLHPNYRKTLVTGNVDSLQMGLGTQDASYAFVGRGFVLRAGSGGFVATAGGNITWLTTGAVAEGLERTVICTGPGTFQEVARQKMTACNGKTDLVSVAGRT